MGFDIKHGTMKSITELSKLAGEAKKGIRSQQLLLGISQDIERQSQQFAMAEFNALMQMESQKRNIEWQHESRLMAQQNDFAIKQEIYRMEQQRQYAEDVKKEQEYKRVIEQIDKAIEQGKITSDVGETMKINATAKHGMGPQAPQAYMPKQADAGAGGKVMRQTEDDLMHYQDIINSFGENENIPGIGQGVVDLAKLDDEGNVMREATEQEKAIYQYAQMRSAQNIAALNPMGGAAPKVDTGVADPLGILGR
jgi:hypothetical protein